VQAAGSCLAGHRLLTNGLNSTVELVVQAQHTAATCHMKCGKQQAIDWYQHAAAHHDGHSAYAGSAQQLGSKAAHPTQANQQHIQRSQLVKPLLTN
jgi:hypothetical protein